MSNYEPSSKRVCTQYNIQPIEYHRMFSENYMTLLEDVDTRINTINNIIDELTIESNKQTWYKDLEKYYIVKNMILNNNFNNLVINNTI
jgi:hypothetical protein